MEPADENTLRKMYVDGQLSWREVGTALGVSERTAKRWGASYGIESRPARTWSERSRAKMAAAKTGRKRAPFSAEWKENISAGHKGQVVSEEQRRFLRRKFTGRVFSDESRQRMSDAQRRKAPPSEQSNRKRSDTMKRRWLDPAYRERQGVKSAAMRGKSNPRFGVTPPLSASKWRVTIVLPDGRRATFRSRLEATAAYALSSAGIDWQYEEHRFVLAGMEGTYAPDFFLPKSNCFVEIGGRDDQKKKYKRQCFHADFPAFAIVEWDHRAVGGLARGTVTVMELLIDPRAGRGRRTRVAEPFSLEIVGHSPAGECLYKG